LAKRRCAIVAYPHAPGAGLSASADDCADLHKATCGEDYLPFCEKSQGRPKPPTREIVVPHKQARTFLVRRGDIFRITAGGPQVGDLNLFADTRTGPAEITQQPFDRRERFFASKTRQLHRTHLSIGDRLWSGFPYLRPMATIIADTLSWYSVSKGGDGDGAGVHDVIGSRCDPYTMCRLAKLGQDPCQFRGFPNVAHNFHYCCQSNIVRALVEEAKIPLEEAERAAHDVLNVFMCTGFFSPNSDTVKASASLEEAEGLIGKYFMKRSPVAKGDFLEFYAEMDLLGVLSACPGGDCGEEHSSDAIVGAELIIGVWERNVETDQKDKDWRGDAWSEPAVYMKLAEGRHGLRGL